MNPLLLMNWPYSSLLAQTSAAPANSPATAPSAEKIILGPVSQSQFMKMLGPIYSHTHWTGWVGLLAAILLAVILGKLGQVVLQRLAERMRQRQFPYQAIILDSAANPLNLILLSVGIHLGLGGLHAEALGDFIARVMALLYLLAAGWFLFNVVDLLDVWLTRLTKRTTTKLDDMMVPLIRKTLRVFLVVVFALVVAQNIFGLNITGFLAGLGIAGLAVSLAAQDSIRNLFGSLTVVFDHPFAVGDQIIIEGRTGIVEEIGFRSTRLRTSEGFLFTVPNMRFIDTSVPNLSARPYIGRTMDLALAIDTPWEKIERAAELVRKLLGDPEIAGAFDGKAFPPVVAFDAMPAGVFNLKIQYWYILSAGRNDATHLAFVQNLNLKVLRAFAQEGIRVVGQPAPPPPPPPAPPSSQLV